MKLSIVIPARNEEGNVEKTVVKLRDYLDAAGVHDLEILVVDDGSRDDTAAVARANGVKHVVQFKGRFGPVSHTNRALVDRDSDML